MPCMCSPAQRVQRRVASDDLGLLDYRALLRALLSQAMMQPTQPQDAGALLRLQVRGLFRQGLPQNRN